MAEGSQESPPEGFHWKMSRTGSKYLAKMPENVCKWSKEEKALFIECLKEHGCNYKGFVD